MDLGASPADIRAAAARLRALADESERIASGVLGAHAVDWKSVAADRFRAEVSDRSREVSGLTEQIGEAALALGRLAAALESQQHNARGLPALTWSR